MIMMSKLFTTGPLLAQTFLFLTVVGGFLLTTSSQSFVSGAVEGELPGAGESVSSVVGGVMASITFFTVASLGGFDTSHRGAGAEESHFRRRMGRLPEQS